MTTGREFPTVVVRRVAVFAALLLGSGLPAVAAPPSPAPAHPAPAKTPEPSPQRPVEPDTVSRNAVARTRMLECGHQWNSLKRAGTASGTWKDFSRGCLAQR